MFKFVKYLLTITIISILGMAVFGASITFVSMPQTYIEALEHAEPRYDGPIEWTYKYHGSEHQSTIDLGITEEEFRASMNRGIMRYATIFDPPAIHMVDPNDRYVKAIADDVRSKADDGRDLATIALNFVQTVIKYEYDWDNFGCRSFAATPLETLYLKKGDCEDTSILLMSIYLALGLDCEMLDYPDHVAVGVRWNDSTGYLYCETTCDHATYLGGSISVYRDGLHEYPMGSIPDACMFINEGIGWYRNAIRKVFGI